MKSNYKILGDYIRQIDKKNTDERIKNLLGVSIKKEFISSVANVIGTDMSKYKIVRKNQFACKLMSVGRDKQLPIDLLKEHEEAIVSSAYYVFEVIDENILLSGYLLMWFLRSETDRWVGFVSGGDVRGGISWGLFCEMPIIIPTLEKQAAIVKEYQTITNRITLNEQLNEKLEATAQTLYKHWFVDFEFPNEQGLPYQSNGGEMVWNEVLEMDVPLGWEVNRLEEICSKIGSGSTPKGGKGSYHTSGISLIRSMNVYDYNFQYRDLAFINNQQAAKLANVEIQKEDILINITGASVARSCVVPSYILPARVNQHVAIIRPFKKHSIIYYLHCLICSKPFKSEIVGISEAASTRQAINKAEIDSFKILKPQQEISQNFEALMSNLFKYKEHLIFTNQKLLNFTDLLLQKMAKL
jgi:type I restriction enzyme S subunit